MTSTPPLFAEHDFRKASASHPNSECVRVARRDGRVELRDDKTPFGAPHDLRLVFTETQFDTFQAGVRSANTTGLCLEITRGPDGTHTFRSGTAQTSEASPELTFTEAEVTAFLDGIAHGEFDHDTTRDIVHG